MVNVKAINDERLGRWKNQMNRKHATPLLLVGVGHDHNNGDIVILTTEERTEQETLAIILGVATKLQEQINSQN